MMDTLTAIAPVLFAIGGLIYGFGAVMRMWVARELRMSAVPTAAPRVPEPPKEPEPPAPPPKPWNPFALDPDTRPTRAEFDALARRVEVIETRDAARERIR
jgi:hypothetical protein